MKPPKKIIIAACILGAVLAAGCSDRRSKPKTTNPVPPSEKVEGFTIAVLPDTQKYSRYRPEIFDAQTQWIADNYRKQHIVFTAHLGDVVDLPRSTSEWAAARNSFSTMEANNETPYSVLAGNHDVLDSRVQDKDRNLDKEPYLQNFHPNRQRSNFDTIKGQDATGFNTYHKFTAGGREYLVLAMDWLPSEESFAWAENVLKQNPNTPTIVTTHQLMNIAPDGETAIFTENGKKIWDKLIKNNDQVFLSFNGHHHGEAKMTVKNAYGRDVTLIVVDYQSGYWGGNGMLQLANFIEEKNKIKFRSYSPWVAQIPNAERKLHDELERWKFEIDLDFDKRFSDLNSNKGAKSEGAIDGVTAYWTFDQNGLITSTDDHSKVSSVQFRDLSGNGNTLSLDWQQAKDKPVSDFDRANKQTIDSSFFEIAYDAPGYGYSEGSILLDGSNSEGGYFLKTTSPSIASTGDNSGVMDQYTFEAVVKISPDWTPGENQWGSVLAHRPNQDVVCKVHRKNCTGEDGSNGIQISSLAEVQWTSVGKNGVGPSNWSWALEKDNWYHVAITNDGTWTTMYIDGARVMRTAEEEQHGLITVSGAEWMVGLGSWNNNYSDKFRGQISEIRIADRVLSQDEWLSAH